MRSRVLRYTLGANQKEPRKEPRTMMSLLELFVSVDDFCQIFLPFLEARQLEGGSKKRLRRGQLSVSEITPVLACRCKCDYHLSLSSIKVSELQSLLHGICLPASAQ